MNIKIQNKTYYFSQYNPYSNEWSCVDENYDCDFDSESGFYSSCPRGYGKTKLDAFKDYLDCMIDDLTDEQYEELKKNAINTLEGL